MIKEEWILDTIKKPVKTEVQTDGRIRKWKFIEEVGANNSGDTIHNYYLNSLK